MAVHQRKHSNDDAECSKSYFQRGRASIALRCCQLGLAVGAGMNNAGQNTEDAVKVGIVSKHKLKASSIFAECIDVDGKVLKVMTVQCPLNRR